MKDTLKQKAKRILEHLLSGNLDAPVADRVRQWFAEEENREQKEQVLEELFDKWLTEHEPDEQTIRKYAELAELLGLSNKRKYTEPVVLGRKRKGVNRWVLRAAAVLVPLLIVGGALLVWNSRTEEPLTGPEPVLAYTTVSDTDVSGQELILPDGTKVWLSDSTRVVYTENFTEDRKVRLTGEAFFQVVKDEAHPFSVETESVTVTVLGTEFNLKAYPEAAETVVSLASGKVEVADPTQKITLAPMEQLVYGNATGESVITDFDPALIDRWQNKPLQLIDVPLREALGRTAAYFGLTLELPARLPDRKITLPAIKRRDGLDDVLESFRFMTDNSFEYHIHGDSVTITVR